MDRPELSVERFDVGRFMRNRPSRRNLLLPLLALALLELSCTRAATEGTAPHEHLYPVALQGKWGYMDSTGAVRIKPSFDEADAFVEERARVSAGKKQGFIDPKGNFVAKPDPADLRGQWCHYQCRCRVLL
jgi:hypothetical protein